MRTNRAYKLGGSIIEMDAATRAQLQTQYLEGIGPDASNMTIQLLQSVEDIPDDFLGESNLYTQLAGALFRLQHLPDLEITIKPGYTVALMDRVVREYIRSWEPDHRRRISGIGYLISQVATLQPYHAYSTALD